MKLCLSCGASYESLLTRCSGCGFAPEQINGFDAYASDFAHEGGGFKAEHFANLARLEDANFWFRARNELILWALEKYCRSFNSFFEIGCGTGYVLSGVAKRFPNTALQASEIFVTGLKFAAQRLPAAKLMQMDARQIPFVDEFDVLGAFDVIEHIEEDELVLAQMQTALKPQGHLLITVPQHAWLWSPSDDYACHVRRYTAADLHAKLEHAGFRILRSSSFVSALLPAMMASRLLHKKASTEEFDPTAELRISPWLNSVFYSILRAELGIIKSGINLPLGGSRFIVAQKIETSGQN